MVVLRGSVFSFKKKKKNLYVFVFIIFFYFVFGYINYRKKVELLFVVDM